MGLSVEALYPIGRIDIYFIIIQLNPQIGIMRYPLGGINSTMSVSLPIGSYRLSELSLARREGL